MIPLHRLSRTALAAVAIVISAASLAQADWAACQSKPTRTCILDEAFSKNGTPLAGKDRLDILVQAGTPSHPEYATSADIAEAQKLAQSAGNFTVINYALIAIKGLVAANQKQQAIDLVGSFTGAMQDIGIRELTRSLVKAGDLATALKLTERLQPPIDPKRLPQYQGIVATEAIKTLATEGNVIEKALALMAAESVLAESTLADMQIAVAQGYAKRDDTKSARDYYDKAEKNLQAAIGAVKVRVGEIQLRYAVIRVMALRGDGDAVKSALQQADPADPHYDRDRSLGVRQVVAALAETKQFRLAIDIAKAVVPVADRDSLLAGIAGVQASDGRLADARATLALLADSGETLPRLVALRSLAAATAKAGDVASALEISGRIKDPTMHAAALFLVAQAMPQ